MPISGGCQPLVAAISEIGFPAGRFASLTYLFSCGGCTRAMSHGAGFGVFLSAFGGGQPLQIRGQGSFLVSYEADRRVGYRWDLVGRDAHLSTVLS